MSMDSNLQLAFQEVANKIKLRQPSLVSGTNIKTINGVSVLGSGDMTVVASPSVYIQETEPTIGSGTVLWIQTLPNNSFTLWLKTQDIIS